MFSFKHDFTPAKESKRNRQTSSKMGKQDVKQLNELTIMKNKRR